MKRFIVFSFLLIFVWTFNSCTTNECPPSLWAGTYEGNQTTNQDPVTIWIEATNTEEIKISYVLETSTGERTMEYENIKITDCQFGQRFEIDGTEINLSGTLQEDLLWLRENVYETPGSNISMIWSFSANRI